MTTSSISINNLASELLARIFAFLPPDERVRLERVCRKWQKVARKHAWIEFRTLKLTRYEGRDDELFSETDWELAERKRNELTLAKYQALIDRCAQNLRQLRIVEMGDCIMEQWPRLRNLRHLRFDSSVSAETLRAVTDNLKRLQSVHFFDIDSCSVAGLRDLLCIDNASLQALGLPASDFHGESLHLRALPYSLRSLQIRANDSAWLGEELDRERAHINELLELAALYCHQLAILILPIDFGVNELTLAKLSQFERIFFLRPCFNKPSNDNILVFGNYLENAGSQLRALFLENTHSKILHLIAKHCPLLEHCSFDFLYIAEEDGYCSLV